MKRVVVLGGYGSFGARISELLARNSAFAVVVAGRSLSRARAFCDARPDLALTPAQVDRTGGPAELAALRPWLVVDAAGPFQGASYQVALACIAMGSHYIDIADASAFVAGFATLDAAAREAEVTLIAGASSVPALSSAVADRLATGMDRVALISSAITASNRATVGASVLTAILSYVGQHVLLRQAGRSFSAPGWSAMARMDFAAAGARPLLRRWLALCDVPDLRLLSDRYPGAPLVLFRAGGEFALQNWLLWLLGWLVRFGWVRSLRPLAPAILTMRALTRRLGSDRSAMSVRVVGSRGGQTVQRDWTMIAQAGQGPYTPCLATPLLARRLAQGGLPPGAYPAVGLLTIDEFQDDFRKLGFVTATLERVKDPPLYQRVMGPAFAILPPEVRAMHGIAGAALAEGLARVVRGTNPFAALVAWAMRFPRAGERIAVQVRFLERDGVETWTRRFGGAGFTSHLSQRGDLLVERFGLLRFGFHLEAESSGLSMHLRRWWCGPVPMPIWLGPRGIARESQRDGRFQFDVPISLPIIGLIVRYTGWLQRLG